MKADDLRTAAFVERIRSELKKEDLPGIAFDTIKITEMAIVRTLRLLQDSWKPMTSLAPEGTHF
jgi:hypothetical protein